MKTSRHKINNATYWLALTLLLVMLVAPGSGSGAQGQEPDQRYRVQLHSRQFVPARGIEPALVRELAQASTERQHVLLQFTALPTTTQRAALQKAGIQLLNYVPHYAWFASIPANHRAGDIDPALLRWMGQIQPTDRLAPPLRQATLASAGPIELEVLFFDDIPPNQASEILYAHQAAIDSQVSDNRYAVHLDPAEIAALAEEDGVLWIAPAPPPKVRDNDGVRARIGADVIYNAPYGLTGSGVDLGIWDGGVVDDHIDLSARLTIANPYAGVDDHATHVAGTMAGDGQNSAARGGTPQQWKGVAPGADVISYDWNNPVNEHNQAINTYGIELSQNSWGYGISGSYGNCYLYGDYDSSSADYDDIATGRYGKRILVVFSAGNERNDGDCGMSPYPPYINYANIGPPHTAKNAIIVGATNSNDDSMTTFSSWGPTDDGRLKPDIVAPGCESTGEGYIHSTLLNNSYGGSGWCGTSMSAPAVSGLSALLIEQYRITEGGDPLPSTIKALLIHTAQDLNDSATVYYNPGPDYASGYGQVDAQSAADTIRNQHMREDAVADGQSDTYPLTVPAGTPSLKVTLVWDDVPGTVSAQPDLINNLDLTLVSPDGTTTVYPWILDPAHPTNAATRGVDNLNNVEQVLVSQPAAGTWQVHISGTHVPQGPQLYSLVSSISTEVIEDVGPVTYKNHTIDDSQGGGNGNGVANPGETIQLTVTLGNDGTDPAQDVWAVLSTNDPYVSSILNDTATYGDIAGGATATHSSPLSFQIDSDAPDGHVIQFSLTINASNDGPWSDTVDITVHEDDDTLHVSIVKSAQPTTVSAGQLLTYTINRGLWLSGMHTYEETLIDPLPIGTNYVANSAILNGVPVEGVYSPTLNSIYLEQSGTFNGSNEITLIFQVQVGQVTDAVINTVVGTASIDGTPLEAPYTDTVSVDVCATPAAPTLLSPVDGFLTMEQRPEFTWKPTAGAYQYLMQVDDDPNFTSPIVEATVLATTFTPATGLNNSVYYWRVRAFGFCGLGTWSPAWSVTIGQPWSDYIYLPIVLDETGRPPEAMFR